MTCKIMSTIPVSLPFLFPNTFFYTKFSTKYWFFPLRRACRPTDGAMPRSDSLDCQCTSRRIKFLGFPAVTMTDGLPCHLDNNDVIALGRVHEHAGIMRVCLCVAVHVVMLMKYSSHFVHRESNLL